MRKFFFAIVAALSKALRQLPVRQNHAVAAVGDLPEDDVYNSDMEQHKFGV